MFSRGGARDRSPKLSIGLQFTWLQHKFCQALASTLSDENVSGSNTYELCKTGRRTPKNNKQYTLSSNKNYDFIYKLEYILYD